MKIIENINTTQQNSSPCLIIISSTVLEKTLLINFYVLYFNLSVASEGHILCSTEKQK